MCYHAEFGRSALKGVCINTGEPRRWGMLKLRSPEIGGVAGHKVHALPDMCCHVKFGSSATKSVGINSGEPEYLGSAWPCHLRVGHGRPLKQDPSPYASPIQIW